jgi:TolA-binding protein
MKSLFNLTLVFFFSCSALFAQLSNNAQVGKIIYMEGNVEVNSGGSWNAATINTPLNLNQSIRTSPGALAEISWISGSKTTIEPSSTYDVKVLFEGASNTAKTETESVFSGFMKVFKSSSESKRSEEGGIRRNQAEVRAKPDQDDMYWKLDDEMTFEEASQQYVQQEYAKAIVSLQSFINQKPRDGMVKYAIFAMGHSYIMINNTVKAREVFQDFISQYYNDPLSEEAEKVLAKL